MRNTDDEGPRDNSPIIVFGTLAMGGIILTITAQDNIRYAGVALLVLYGMTMIGVYRLDMLAE